ncbi:hypothetical protein [Streptomyces sp. NPDC050560]|uniref:hypothetical protein n=1 Tax=Streptomyces sp. NPDC050560 TaxID=3365630 RepID=UPI0037883058
MGASGWQYMAPYDGSVEAALATAQRRVLASGEYIWPWETRAEYGVPGDSLPRPATLDELKAAKDSEDFWEEGTHSILDIEAVVDTTEEPDPYEIDDFGTLRPLRPERIRHHFGTELPTPDQYAELVARPRRLLPGGDLEEALTDESGMRWTGRYVLLYTGDTVSHVGMFGYSGD